MLSGELGFYLKSRSRSPWHYVLGELLQGLLGWMPGLPGIALRAVLYKSFLRTRGLAAIEDHVRLVRPEDIRLGRHTYIDTGVYLHGGTGGLEIGDGAWVMNGCRLHVFNFRGLPQAGIRIGSRTFIGEGTIMRGQGGIVIGDNVLFGPRVLVMAVNHVFGDTSRPIMDQGIVAAGIRIEDGAWIGAGAVILDGVVVGRGACIGAGAVVTTSVPPHTVAVGIPAKVVRDLERDPLPARDAAVHFGGLEQFGAGH